MDTHCARSFCKHVLCNPAEYADVETVEPDCYKSRKLKLKQVLDTPLDMLGLELTLSAEAAIFTQHEAKRVGGGFDLI
jgi:hypothetical protein